MTRLLLLVLFATLFHACTNVAGDDGEYDHITLTNGAPEPKTLASHKWTAEEAALLSRAIVEAQRMTADTMFRAVVAEMEAGGEISWQDPPNFNNYPVHARAQPVAWLLTRYDSIGHYALADIRGATRLGTEGRTRAMTPAPGTTTRFHRRIVRDDDFASLVGSVVHERSHSFAHEHRSQSRKVSRCEAPYVLGDLTSFLIARRASAEPVRVTGGPFCAALTDRLRRRNIVR